MLDSLHQEPFDHPGPIDNQDKLEGFYFTEYRARPVRNRSEFEDWFSKRLQVSKDFGRSSSDIPYFTGFFLNFVFCHMDIHSHNVILDRENHIWIIDWERSGGYPFYFEEAQAAIRIHFNQPKFKIGLVRFRAKFSSLSDRYDDKKKENGTRRALGASSLPSDPKIIG